MPEADKEAAGLNEAGHRLNEHLKELGLEAYVGIGDNELIVLRRRRLNPPVLKNLEAEGWQGFKVRSVYHGPIKLANE